MKAKQEIGERGRPREKEKKRMNGRVSLRKPGIRRKRGKKGERCREELIKWEMIEEQE